MNCTTCIFYRGVAGFRAAFCGFEGARKSVPFDKASRCAQFTHREGSFVDARKTADVEIRFFAPRVGTVEIEDGIDAIDEDARHWRL